MPRPDRPAARRGLRLRRRRLQRDRHLPRVHPATPSVRAVRLRGRRRRASTPAGTRPASPAARPACCTAPAPTCCRTRTARPSSRTRSRPGLDYPGVGPEHAWLHDTGRARTRRSTTPRRWRRSSCCAGPRASSRRSRARTRWPARCGSAASWGRTRRSSSTCPVAATRTSTRPARGSACSTRRSSSPRRAAVESADGRPGSAGRAAGLLDASCAAQAEGRAALVGYLPAGFPVGATAPSTRWPAMVESGVDLVEVGLPYSDPVMDGPVIQRAAEIALARRHHGPPTCCAPSRRSPRTGVPALVMTYWNPVERYGVEPVRRATSPPPAAPALITPDLMPDEAEPSGSPPPTSTAWTGSSWSRRRRPTPGSRYDRRPAAASSTPPASWA